MSNPKRVQRRNKRKRRKKGKGHAGYLPEPPGRLMPRVLSPDQIESMFAPLREAFADVGEREASSVAPEGGLPGASDA